MDESTTTQNRRNRRSNVLLAATLEVSGNSLPVKMRNLSAEGVLIQGAQLPIEGSEIVFRKGDLSVAGRIAWTDGKQAGIAFARPLPPAMLLRHVTAPRPRVQPKFHRPGLQPRKLSADEVRFGEIWAGAQPIDRPGE